ncbi:MAG: hypothetical protein UHX00_04685 [Caryophanon sp.]|nr:hypothetical protein [Caryophanon sp.]
MNSSSTATKQLIKIIVLLLFEEAVDSSLDTSSSVTISAAIKVSSAIALSNTMFKSAA